MLLAFIIEQAIKTSYEPKNLKSHAKLLDINMHKQISSCSPMSMESS